MTQLPGSTETIRDPGLGVSGPLNKTMVIVGQSSAGVDSSVHFFSNASSLLDTVGRGTGPEAVAHILATAGGPVGFVKCPTTVASVIGAVSAPGGPAITITGEPNNDFEVRIDITGAGDLGTAVAKYSLDGYSGAEDDELTFSSEFTVPIGGSYVATDSGLTLTFAAGTYVVGQSYTATVTCAASNATDLSAAMDALIADGRDWAECYTVTSDGAGDSTAHVLLATAFEGKLAAQEALGQYKAGIINSNIDDSDPLTDWTPVVAPHLLVAHGTARVSSAIPFVGHSAPRVGGGIVFSARSAGSLVSTDLKRVPGNGVNDGGALPRVLKIFVDARVDGGEAFDGIKLSTLRTYYKRTGFYITQGRIKSADGSDFTIWPRRLVINQACEVTRDIQTTFVGRGLRATDAGTIDERDALRLEEEVETAIIAAFISPKSAEGVPGHISAYRYRIDRVNNVATTATVRATLGIRPLANIDYIYIDVGFTVDLGEN